MKALSYVIFLMFNVVWSYEIKQLENLPLEIIDDPKDKQKQVSKYGGESSGKEVVSYVKRGELAQKEGYGDSTPGNGGKLADNRVEVYRNNRNNELVVEERGGEGKLADVYNGYEITQVDETLDGGPEDYGFVEKKGKNKLSCPFSGKNCRFRKAKCTCKSDDQEIKFVIKNFKVSKAHDKLPKKRFPSVPEAGKLPELEQGGKLAELEAKQYPAIEEGYGVSEPESESEYGEHPSLGEPDRLAELEYEPAHGEDQDYDVSNYEYEREPVVVYDATVEDVTRELDKIEEDESSFSDYQDSVEYPSRHELTYPHLKAIEYHQESEPTRPELKAIEYPSKKEFTHHDVKAIEYPTRKELTYPHSEPVEHQTRHESKYPDRKAIEYPKEAGSVRDVKFVDRDLSKKLEDDKVHEYEYLKTKDKEDSPKITYHKGTYEPTDMEIKLKALSEDLDEKEKRLLGERMRKSGFDAKLQKKLFKLQKNSHKLSQVEKYKQKLLSKIEKLKNDISLRVANGSLKAPLIELEDASHFEDDDRSLGELDYEDRKMITYDADGDLEEVHPRSLKQVRGLKRSRKNKKAKKDKKKKSRKNKDKKKKKSKKDRMNKMAKKDKKLKLKLEKLKEKERILDEKLHLEEQDIKMKEKIARKKRKVAMKLNKLKEKQEREIQNVKNELEGIESQELNSEERPSWRRRFGLRKGSSQDEDVDEGDDDDYSSVNSPLLELN